MAGHRVRRLVQRPPRLPGPRFDLTANEPSWSATVTSRSTAHGCWRSLRPSCPHRHGRRRERAIVGSRIREIVMLGRRGPVQAAFTHPSCRSWASWRRGRVVDPRDLELDPASAEALDHDRERARGTSSSCTSSPSATAAGSAPPDRSPLPHVPGRDPRRRAGRGGGGRAQRARPPRTAASSRGPRASARRFRCGLVLRSVGYRGVELPGVPFDERRRTLPNQAGRVDGAERTYATAGSSADRAA